MPVSGNHWALVRPVPDDGTTDEDRYLPAHDRT